MDTNDETCLRIFMVKQTQQGGKGEKSSVWQKILATLTYYVCGS
jgi:hypothetical protein